MSKQVHPTKSDSHTLEIKRQKKLATKMSEFEQAMAGLLFLTQSDRQMIMLSVRDTKVSGAKCDTLIEYIGIYIDLLRQMSQFKGEANNKIARAGSDEGELLKQAKIEFKTSYLETIEKLESMVKHLLINSSFDVPKKDLELLERAASATYHFYHSPLVPQAKDALIDTTKQIYHKMGQFWHGLKTVLTHLVGFGCIVIGALGVIPSLGGSLAMIGAGSALILSTIPRLVDTHGHQTRKQAGEVSAAMEKMRVTERFLTQAKNQDFDAKRVVEAMEKHQMPTLTLGGFKHDAILGDFTAPRGRGKSP
jgi:hypothetical protein